jgi:methylglutaconyl-CoA hydratase
MASLVPTATADGVAVLELASPANRNALSRALRSDLAAALATVAADTAVRAVVLSHAGPAFSAGADLKEVGEPDPADVPSLGDLIIALRSCPKPVVAALDGPARAGGLGLVAACDLAIAADHITFAFTEVRLGVVPAVISAVVLPLLTQRWASDLLLTGRVFTSAEAVEAGLLTRCVSGSAREEALRVADELALGGPGAMAGTKALLRATTDTDSLRRQLDELTRLSETYFASEEGREGVRAFAERRRPAWVG